MQTGRKQVGYLIKLIFCDTFAVVIDIVYNLESYSNLFWLLHFVLL